MNTTTKYFVDSQGNYIGGFDGEAALALVPENAIEVPFAPDNATQKWNGEDYDAPEEGAQ